MGLIGLAKWLFIIEVAVHLVSFFQLNLRRDFNFATVHDFWATWMEMTSGWWVKRGGNISRKWLWSVAGLRVEGWLGSE